MQNIGSSNILKAGYSKPERTLSIVFINRPNWLYLYHNVSIQRWVAFLRASSKGEYFAKHIKDSYEFKKEIHNKKI